MEVEEDGEGSGEYGEVLHKENYYLVESLRVKHEHQ